MKKIYIGNLPYSTTEADLETLCTPYGEVISVNLIQDRETGRSKGFGFVEFDKQAQAEAALELDGNDFQGRPLRVNMAREQAAGGRRGGGNGGGRRQQW